METTNTTGDKTRISTMVRLTIYTGAIFMVIGLWIAFTYPFPGFGMANMGAVLYVGGCVMGQLDTLIRRGQ